MNNEFQTQAKFLVWIVEVIFALGLFAGLGKLTYTMAEAAIDAHQNDQLSYGKFSRQLWRTPNKK